MALAAAESCVTELKEGLQYVIRLRRFERNNIGVWFAPFI